MTDTPLDAAHRAMQATPKDDRRRLRFYERLADAELVLLLEREAEGDRIEPALFEPEDGRFVLAFDGEDRLAAFVGEAAPYAALSGRALVAMLAGQGIGLGLNLEVAPSSILIPAEAVDWLAAMLDRRPDEAVARPATVGRPQGLPDDLLDALEAKFRTAVGLAESAVLAHVTYDDGRDGHLLAMLGAVPGAEPALAQAVAEAVAFSGLEMAALDLAFPAQGDPAVQRLLRHGLRIDLPVPTAQPAAPAAPGMDPDRPPRLR